MKKTLCQITRPWRRQAIRVLMSFLLLLNRFNSSRAYIHWVGRYNRPRRRERALFAFLFLGTLLAAGPQRHITWLTAWGGALAIFLNLLMLYQFIPRKRAHWVR